MLNPLRALDNAPRWLRSLLRSISRGRGPLGQLYDRIFHHYIAAQIPDVPAWPSASRRLIVGPTNDAEQGFQWARAFERNLQGVSAIAMVGVHPGPYNVRADLSVAPAVYLRASAFHDPFQRLVEGGTHVLHESALPLLGRRFDTDAFAEISHFREAGLQVGVMFHGSDLRLPSQHLMHNEWSPFRDPEVPSQLLEEKATRNVELVRQLGVPAFVSTPDLLEYLPEATWCPVVIDVDEWRQTYGPRLAHTGPMVVVHAPSNPAIKGSALIEPALLKLQAEGVIDYRSLSGLTHQEISEQFAVADIVLDQFLIGSYGVAACEALASGCLVIGHVNDATRRAVLDSTGLELPIVEATVTELESVIRRVVAEPEAFEAFRRHGLDFVERVHDGRLSAQAIQGFLDARPLSERTS